jgi:hypothetical protein
MLPLYGIPAQGNQDSENVSRGGSGILQLRNVGSQRRRRPLSRQHAVENTDHQPGRSRRVNTNMQIRNIARCAVLVISRGWFPALWAFIGVVSAIDTYLIFRFRDLMWSLEKNFVGRYLIALDSGNVALFIRTKIVGTIVVLGTLACLYIYRRRWSVPVTAAVAAFQCGLFIYMVFTVPVIPGMTSKRTVWDDVAVFLPSSDGLDSSTQRASLP